MDVNIVVLIAVLCPIFLAACYITEKIEYH